MESERRKDERISVSLEAKFFGGAQGGARISDISLGGCYVETIAYFNAGDVIDVEIKMPNGTWLSLKGKISYTHPSMGFGMRFHDLSQYELDVLSGLMDYEKQK